MNKAIQNSPLAVIYAPLGKTDRRALSEAWYSALHLQTRQDLGAQTRRRVGKSYERRSGVRVRGDQPFEGRSRISTTPSGRTMEAGIRQNPGCERRASRLTVARKIERLAHASQGCNQSATLTLEGDHGRVHIVIRVIARQVRVIAVCAPKARDIVRDALLQARCALARNGMALDATLQSAAS